MPSTFYIIAGPNGAGKTTASKQLIPSNIPFVNADMIAKENFPEDPEADTSAVKAARIALQQIDSHITNKRSFAFETTLSGSGLKNHILHAKEQGFEIMLFFFWLPSSDFAIQRVKQRVRDGGHNIPADTVRRRYKRGLERLKSFYLPYMDRWYIYDNSVLPSFLAAKKDDCGVAVYSGYIKYVIDQMRNENKSHDDETNKIINEVDQAYKNMLIEKIDQQQIVITADSEGNIICVDPSVIYEHYYGTQTK